MDTLSYALRPHKVTEIESEYKTKIVEFENGAEQRFAARATPITTYKFIWTILTASELSSLQSFFNSQLGALRPWLIIDSRVNGGASTRVRFKGDKLPIHKINAMFSSVGVEVVTC